MIREAEDMSKLPMGYRLQAACVNCRWALMVHDLDVGCSRSYCTLGAPPIPRSVLVRGQMREEDYEIWDAWSEGREVAENGICSEHEEAKESADAGA